jgi:hypothetical protein
MQAPRVEHASFDQQQRGMQQMSRGNFSSPAAGREFGSGAGAPASHGWNRFGEPIHGTNAGGGEASSFNRYSPSASGREGDGGGAVRISPSIVSRPSYSRPAAQPQGSYAPPRSFGGARSAPSAPASRGGGGAPHAGGGGHSGGGGHHR